MIGGKEVGLGNLLEKSAEKLHLEMMFGGEYIFRPISHQERVQQIKIIRKCLPFDNK